ncbi:hypothetical protein GCM10010174_49830 [Kutzneria viridogrisea]|uniref:Uncharacterized protein n=1 Tax=Kutzneria viridogrisea TaxID=47990 RepID=A0ABR6B8N6_9PSEU|nr:hypothetical protein [Kutzneria viridogrisea]
MNDNIIASRTVEITREPDPIAPPPEDAIAALALASLPRLHEEDQPLLLVRIKHALLGTQRMRDTRPLGSWDYVTHLAVVDRYGTVVACCGFTAAPDEVDVLELAQGMPCARCILLTTRQRRRR